MVLLSVALCCYYTSSHMLILSSFFSRLLNFFSIDSFVIFIDDFDTHKRQERKHLKKEKDIKKTASNSTLHSRLTGIPSGTCILFASGAFWHITLYNNYYPVVVVQVVVVIKIEADSSHFFFPLGRSRSNDHRPEEQTKAIKHISSRLFLPSSLACLST